MRISNYSKGRYPCASPRNKQAISWIKAGEAGATFFLENISEEGQNEGFYLPKTAAPLQHRPRPVGRGYAPTGARLGAHFKYELPTLQQLLVRDVGLGIGLAV